jgi:tetratricopeptide (TPR) repeat protein
MKRNLLFSSIGLLLGLWLGFMVANAGYRRELSSAANAAAVQMASQMPGAASVNSSSSGQLTPEQSQQMIDQTRVIIDRARGNPADLEAQLQAAEQFMQIQRPEGALEFLLKADQIKPNDAEIVSSIGEAYLFANKFEQAQDWSRRALKLRPDYPPAMFYLLASLVETNQHLDEAEQLVTKLEAITPRNPALDRALAQVRQQLQQARQQGAGSRSKTMLSHGPEPGGGKP